MNTDTTPDIIAQMRSVSAEPDWQAHVDRNEWNMLNQPARPACPHWCTDKPGHRFDLIDIGETVWSRQHTDDITDNVTMEQVEVYDPTTSSVTLSPPSMSLWVDGTRVEGQFTAQSARALLATIGEGVRRFEEMTVVDS
ncbi:hypothetical protein ACXR2U_04850 [Jatrophihabitans sp. YIM 134969]